MSAVFFLSPPLSSSVPGPLLFSSHQFFLVTTWPPTFAPAKPAPLKQQKKKSVTILIFFSQSQAIYTWLKSNDCFGFYNNLFIIIFSLVSCYNFNDKSMSVMQKKNQQDHRPHCSPVQHQMVNVSVHVHVDACFFSQVKIIC